MTFAWRVSRYWNTVRHLRFEQVAYRLLRNLRPRRRPVCRPMSLRDRAGAWARPPSRSHGWIDIKTARFLNEVNTLPSGSWQVPEASKLWLYNLHYFNDLMSPRASESPDFYARLIARWMAENPPGEGTGWDPYPMSQRIVNWCKWRLGGAALGEDALASMGLQARWLVQRLERHLLGNHLFLNAKALVFVGCLLKGLEADHWRRIGLRILERELKEQILSDGGQFERSPMYHALALEDVLDLLNLAHAYPDLFARTWIVGLQDIAVRMRRWLQVMVHPDGEIAFFNDAAFGIAPTPGEILRYAAELGMGAEEALGDGIHALEASGFVRLQMGNAVVIADVGPIGPDYLPGHAHADTLSFECSIRGKRVLVNSGTSEYGSGPERHRQRGTAAHNTVEVAGQDSSEVWSGFRVGRRARVLEAEWSGGRDCLMLRGSHDGYRALPGRPVHCREWFLRHDALEVRDRVSPTMDAKSMWHWRPGLHELSPDATQLRMQDGTAIGFESNEPAVAVDSTWHPEFGMTVPSRCLVVALRGGAGLVRISWADGWKASPTGGGSH